MQVPIIYAGAELNLFRELTKENVGTLTVTELAEKSGASPALLGKKLHPHEHPSLIHQSSARETSSILCIIWLDSKCRPGPIPSQRSHLSVEHRPGHCRFLPCVRSYQYKT